MSVQQSVPLTVAGNTDKTLPENRKVYPALDGMRAIAFLMVFAQHYLLLPWGWSGVDLFFTLSGFLITGILFDTRNDSHRVRNFYIRRTLRIFPLFYGTLIAVFVLQPFFHWDWDWNWIVWPLYAGNFARFFHPYFPGSALQKLADFQPVGEWRGVPLTLFLGHFWSLCVEEQFYLFWPWIVFGLRRRRALMVLAFSTVPFCLAIRLIAQQQLPGWMIQGEVLYRVTLFRLDALLIGALAALGLRGERRTLWLTLSRVALPIVLGSILLWAVLSGYGKLWLHPYPYPAWRFTWGLTAIDLVSALLILVAIQPQTLVARLLNCAALRWLGRISYGLYVLHDIPHSIYTRAGMFLMSGLGPHRIQDHLLNELARVATAIVALPCTIVLAALSFRFLETPFLNLKEEWTVRS
jgi:peptidoglycan/LPS O-acetylase OafA/YrhL